MPQLTPLLLVLAPALVFAAACGGEDGSADAYPPAGEPQSLVVFLVDTLRADHLGCYGYERDTSPNLDALAASDGVVFEYCLAQSTWTKPTTASIHTGMLPSRHGANEGESLVQPDLQTLADRRTHSDNFMARLTHVEARERVAAKLMKEYGISEYQLKTTFAALKHRLITSGGRQGASGQLTSAFRRMDGNHSGTRP